MDAPPRPVVGLGAALRAPPPTPPPPPLRRRTLPRPLRGVADRLVFSREPRLAPLTRCYCSREGEWNARGKPHLEGFSSVRLNVKANNDQETYLTDDKPKGVDIWELFSESQRNILYLNNQRHVAMEELKKLQDENESLLQDIEVLEMERQGISIETAESPRCCELLLRIDIMAISGSLYTLCTSAVKWIQ